MEEEEMRGNGKSLLNLQEDFATKSQRAQETQKIQLQKGKLAAKAQQAGCWAVHVE
jgi:hypothetical protein